MELVMANKIKICFAMELVRNGELIARGPLREDTARGYFQQLISAINFCHSCGVYHRDSKDHELAVVQEINANAEQEVDVGKVKEVETLNAFRIISLSEGFNVSLFFEEKKRVEKEEMRFATTRPASRVISRIEEVGKTKNFSVRKSESCVRLQWQQSERKGKLAISADIFTVTPSFLVVEVNKSSRDTLDYNHFCSMELCPALKDIEWTSTTSYKFDDCWCG